MKCLTPAQKMKHSDAKKKVLELLKLDGYEITPKLEDRLEMFFISTEKKEDPAHIQSLLHWLGEIRKKCQLKIETIPMQAVEKWRVDPATGAISHESGEFFKVIGIRVSQGSFREKEEWCQPIIYQAEMGILGILTMVKDGLRYFLLQGKCEPGNIDKIQISPTLQATVSNLKRAHGGTKPLFSEYFETPKPGSVIFATYQVEDGGRLFLKNNLNMLVEVDEKEIVDIPENYRWFTMSEIKDLLTFENTINPHIRSIISVM